MKYTNRDVIEMINILSDFSNKRLPQKISYAITRNSMLLQKEYSVYEKELDKTLRSHDDDLEKDDNGNLIMLHSGIPAVKVEISDGLKTELTDLLDIVIDIDIYTIDFDEFNYSDGDKYDVLSPREMVLLQKILCPVE